jgi:hypothetical protein
MSYCPNCGTEYEAGPTVCSDCGAVLVGELTPGGASEPVVALHASTSAEARVAEATLEAEGIPAFVVSGDRALADGEFVLSEGGYVSDELGDLDVVVPPDMAEAARQVLSAPSPTEQELAEAAGFDAEVEPQS